RRLRLHRRARRPRRAERAHPARRPRSHRRGRAPRRRRPGGRALRALARRGPRAVSRGPRRILQYTARVLGRITMSRTARFFFLAAVAGTAVGTSASADAKPKAPPAPPTACGYKSIPLAVGNTWTYRSGPAQIVVKIVDIAPGKDWQGKAATVID